ncbi:MAG: heme oxygenase (biliverdin-producing), partial [Burkholderiaceae bacterium]
RLRAATGALHVEAERSVVMATLLRGELDRGRYVRLLHALHALYARLETALHRHATHPLIAPLELAPLARTAALAADLDAFEAGRRADGTSSAEPGVPPSLHAYVARLAELDTGWPAGLVAHAYVRYLGDLSGGQRLAPIIARSYGLAPGAGTRFYAFGAPESVKPRTQRLRAALDGLPLDEDTAAALVAEARDAFVRHIRLFDELAVG